MIDLGANQFTFIGYEVRISYLTQAPGPLRPGQEGGLLEYHSPARSQTFSGDQIDLKEGPWGPSSRLP